MPREDADMTSVSRRQDRQDPDSEYSDASHAENDHDNSGNVSSEVGVTIRSDRNFVVVGEVRVNFLPRSRVGISFRSNEVMISNHSLKGRRCD